MKTIVVGIGNPILGDDGVGIYIVRNLQKKNFYHNDVCFEEAQTGGMNLLDIIRGYEKAILIDAVSLPGLNQGQIKKFKVEDLQTIHSQNPHDVSFPEALLLANTLGDVEIPKDITIIGVNLKRIPIEFSDSLSNEIKTCIPQAVAFVQKEITKSIAKSMIKQRVDT